MLAEATRRRARNRGAVRAGRVRGRRSSVSCYSKESCWRLSARRAGLCRVRLGHSCCAGSQRCAADAGRARRRPARAVHARVERRERTMLFALAPALQRDANRSSGCARARRARTRRRTGAASAVARRPAQIALAIVLLAGAGLLMRSFVRLAAGVARIRSEAMCVTFRMSASWSERPDAVVARQARTIARLQEIPGVEAPRSARCCRQVIAFLRASSTSSGRDRQREDVRAQPNREPGYFRTLRIPDSCGQHVRRATAAPLHRRALVTRSFADRFFPGTEPIGHARHVAGFPGWTLDRHRRRRRRRARERRPAARRSRWSTGAATRATGRIAHFLVRTSPTPASRIGESARHCSKSSRSARCTRYAACRNAVVSVSQHGQHASCSRCLQRWRSRCRRWVCTASCRSSTTARQREFGVRMALGARPAHVLSSVARQAAWIAGGGIGVGPHRRARPRAIDGGHAVRRRAARSADIRAVPIVLAVVAAIAALVPARRAARVDPWRRSATTSLGVIFLAVTSGACSVIPYNSSVHIISSAPTRIDLAGGTIDIWPLYLFHEHALNGQRGDQPARARRGRRSRGRRHRESARSTPTSETTAALEGPRRVERSPLLSLLARHYQLKDATLTTRGESPAGAGIAGSSALTIAVCAALAR